MTLNAGATPTGRLFNAKGIHPMSALDNQTTALVSPEAISRATRMAVAGALDGDFSIDPIVGPALSHSFSFMASVIQRHGLLIQRTVGDALAASGRFEVMSDVQIPLTETANDLLTSHNSQHDLAKIRLKSDSKAVRIVTVDLVVVDPETGWAGGYDVKRGNGATESRKRRPIEHDLRGIRLVLANHLVKLGYEGITNTTTGIIDYYGMSGFSREIKLVRDELDSHFGVPVVGHVDAMTEALKAALHAELPGLMEPALRKLARAAVVTAAETAAKVAESSDAVPTDVALAGRLNARPVGPGPRRSPAPH
jgi:hypothetical protein